MDRNAYIGCHIASTSSTMVRESGKEINNKKGSDDRQTLKNSTQKKTYKKKVETSGYTWLIFLRSAFCQFKILCTHETYKNGKKRDKSAFLEQNWL